MAFGADQFWQAFKDAGMLFAASHQPDVGDFIEFDVGYQRPDQIVLDGVAHSTEHRIEYRSADVTLRRNSVVLVGGAQLKVMQPPQAKGDGTFMIAYLQEVSA
jgi:hypothetical protein